MVNDFLGIVFLSQPEGDVHQGDQGGHFDKGADDTGEGFAGIDAEDADGDGDGELEVVAGGGKGKGSVLRIVGAQGFTEEEGDQEHDGKVDDQGNGNAHDVKGDGYDELSFQAEHGDNGEQQGDQGDWADSRNEFLFVPLFSFCLQQGKAGEEAGQEGDA